MKTWWQRGIWISLGAILVFAVVQAFRPVPVLVDVAAVERGTLTVTVDDDGWTRVRERYTISAPIRGRLMRTGLDPGDRVEANHTLVGEFIPIAPDLLDARTKSEAAARVQRAAAALEEANARSQQVIADQDYLANEIVRIRDLFQRGIRSQEALDRTERDHRRACQAVRAAEFAAQVAAYELEVARSSLREVDPSDLAGSEALRRLELKSPIDGTVLQVFEESARTLAAGTPILEVGNTEALEIVADYLSQDAVKVEAGMTVFVEGWGGVRPDGGEAVLIGRVRLVEPYGFMKVSALGVEEQRVNIIVDPVEPLNRWRSLGDGYRVELRILLSELEDALIVPTGALFRDREQWAVYVDDAGVARLRQVELGQRNGLEAHVTAGLSDGDRVILYPSDLVAEGSKLETR